MIWWVAPVALSLLLWRSQAGDHRRLDHRRLSQQQQEAIAVDRRPSFLHERSAEMTGTNLKNAVKSFLNNNKAMASDRQRRRQQCPSECATCVENAGGKACVDRWDGCSQSCLDCINGGGGTACAARCH